MFPHVDSVVLGNVAKIASLTRNEANSDTARVGSGISTRTTVELAGLLFDGFSLQEAAEVSIYPQYDSAGGVDSERTFVKQIVQKFCDDGSSDDLFNEEEENSLLTYMFPHVDGVVLGNVAKIANLTRVESKSDTARIGSGISTRTTVELSGLLFDGFSLQEAAEVCIYPQYDSAGGVDSERTFVKQIVQKFCDDGSSEDLFNEEEVLEATEA